MEWAELVAAAPDLAGSAQEAFARSGFGLIGTVRRDGTPRISPVEVHFVDNRLVLVLIAGTRKVRDLDRDPRVLLRTPVTDAAAPEPEITVRGRVRELVDDRLRGTIADAVQSRSGWRPHPSWRFFALDADAASCVEWNGDEMRLTRWDTAHGLRPTQRRRLDMHESRYIDI
ncbi:pyridoxamine 5'-phosphate oxidase family protein [Nocardia iowensis]|uniref:Pyridoxamine 5'-phosphate oxidase family protein n=1 Tax=Nocardia iowensis TaxID=204891 RepID=A0ABX8RLU0_NOCIO|nr:pyridoxamine 5'-phosphate oxidase family protein [Nocardia iowensis]QXN88411.1 pyridoxamine 5'-phosphate oxidase family protein [Nocardia iowensis]